MRVTHTYLASIALGTVLAASANAAVLVRGDIIGIDFGATAPVAGSNFNDYSDVVIADGATESFIATGSLINTDGSYMDGIGFSVENQTGQESWAFTGGLEGFGLMSDSTIYGDGLIANNTKTKPLDAGGYFVFTFTGLNDSYTYNLTGGFDSNNDNFNAFWSTGDGSNRIRTDGDPGVGYVTLEDLPTDGSGNLVITVERTLHATVAGLYLEAMPIPEPASLALLGLGGILIALARRKMATA